MFRILADENMPLVQELFGPIASSITLKAGRDIQQKDLQNIDVLLVRSITQVNSELLSGTQVKFVGSATIGTDHIDQDWLASRNIAFFSSPGCNADAVTDYVIASLCYWQNKTKQSWLDKTIAVIGCGNVGGRIATRLLNAGVSVLCNDPPRQELEGGDFYSLDQALTADIICLHTPLTKSGNHPTHHLINKKAISALKPGALIISAGRGPVIDEAALKERIEQRNDLSLIMDVWETEPIPDQQLLASSMLSTPHIAGYSLDGKIRGSWMLRQALAQWANIVKVSEPISNESLPAKLDWLADKSLEFNINVAVTRVLDLARDSKTTFENLYGLDSEEKIAQKFDLLRKKYPVRRELSCLKISGVPETDQTIVKSLGFQC